MHKEERMEIIEIYGLKLKEKTNLRLPFFETTVAAGMPNPIESDNCVEIDLNELLVDHPASTFFAKVHGLNMIEQGIRDGDILVVDTSIEPSDSKIVLATINGTLTVKIYRELDGGIFLESPNHQFLPVMIEPYMEFKIIGTVTKIIHSL